jgi:hypothetical protein
MSDTESRPFSAPAPEVPTAPDPQPETNTQSAPDHDPSTPPLQDSSSPSPQPSRRRRGKVARLPHRVRELVNLMLRDGLPYADITRKIAEHGYTLNADNLSRWHSGGYQIWLREQDLLDDQHARLQFATRVLNEKNSQAIQETSIRIAILRMYSLLLDFDPSVLKDRVAENPGAYARILNALAKLSSGAIQLERLRLEKTRK